MRPDQKGKAALADGLREHTSNQRDHSTPLRALPEERAPRALKLTGDRNECPTCGEYFNRTSGFDRHRVGKLGTPARRCLTAAEMWAAGFTQNEAGFWLAPMSERQRARQECRFQPIGRAKTDDFVKREGLGTFASAKCAFGDSLHERLGAEGRSNG